MKTTTQQGKLTDDVIERFAIQHDVISGRVPLSDREHYWVIGFARAIEAEVEARTAKKMDALVEAAHRLVNTADFRLGGILSDESKRSEIPSNAYSQVKARHLASLKAALAAHQQDTVAEKGEK